MLSPIRKCLFKQVNRVRHKALILYFNPKYPEPVRSFGDWAGQKLGLVLDRIEKPETEASLARLREMADRAESVRAEFKALQSESGDYDDPEYGARMDEYCMDVLEASDEDGPLTPREEAAFRILDSLFESP